MSEPETAASTPAVAPESDVIHDIGFRHYDGLRLGRGWVVRSLLVETVRGVFGLGRPAKSKVMPWILIGILLIPPLPMGLSVLLIGGDDLPTSYAQYPNAFSLVIVLFVAAAAPYCVSRDMRHQVMPLYFSRPMRRNDYVLAKFAGLSISLFAVLALGETLLLTGALLAKLDLSDQLVGWAGGLLVSALLALILSAVSLVIAAFTPRRGLGVAAIITSLVVLSGIVELLIEITRQKGYETLASYLPLLEPFSIVDGIAVQLLGASSSREHQVPTDLAGALAYVLVAAVVVGGAWLVLNRRYRKVGGV